MSHQRNRREGLAHRERIRTLLLPRLTVGDRLPRSVLLSQWLGVCPSQAVRHMRRALLEAGCQLETRYQPGRAGRRTIVIAIPEETRP